MFQITLEHGCPVSNLNLVPSRYTGPNLTATLFPTRNQIADIGVFGPDTIQCFGKKWAGADEAHFPQHNIQYLGNFVPPMVSDKFSEFRESGTIQFPLTNQALRFGWSHCLQFVTDKQPTVLPYSFLNVKRREFVDNENRN
jgi:hypothetical protein